MDSRSRGKHQQMPPGKLASSTQINRIVNGLNRNENSGHFGPVENIPFPGNGQLGILVDAGSSGEEDLEGGQYWVATAYCTNSEEDETDNNKPMTTDTDDQAKFLGGVYPMTHLGEIGGGDHSLPVDGTCTVLYFITSDAVGGIQYYFLADRGGGGIGSGEFQGMAPMNVTQNQIGFSYMFFHELV